MNAIVAVIAVAIVSLLAVLGVQYLFGQWAWVAYCVAAFFGFMGLMAKLNAT